MGGVTGGIVIPIVALFFIWTIPKGDTRYKGFRIASFGILLFGLAWVGLFYVGYLPSPFNAYLAAVFYLIAFLGIGIFMKGQATHIGRMYASLKDPGLDVNPEYDYQGNATNYALCPACKNAQVKVDTVSAICPLCKESITRDVETEILYCKRCNNPIREEDVRGDVCPFCSEDL